VKDREMVTLGYKLMAEEHGPVALVRNTVRAERAGFAFAAISDHFFPWLDEQGHAPFAWSVTIPFRARSITVRPTGALEPFHSRLGRRSVSACSVLPTFTGLKQRVGESRVDLMAYRRTPWS
jgi:hypothetical protein